MKFLYEIIDRALHIVDESREIGISKWHGPADDMEGVARHAEIRLCHANDNPPHEQESGERAYVGRAHPEQELGVEILACGTRGGEGCCLTVIRLEPTDQLLLDLPGD